MYLWEAWKIAGFANFHARSPRMILKYKQTEYVAVEYPPTEKIMADHRRLKKEIGEEMNELARLLGF